MGKTYDDRWEVIGSLGEGGQAHTFLVRDTEGQSETRYVLKRLKNINRIERFKREIEAVRNLSHENIVRLIDFKLEAEKPYLVTEYCSGGSLSQAEPFWHESPIRALGVFQQICKGVAYAHSQNVIHRDLKPDNVFLRTKDGPAVVGDFGICWVEEDGTRITLTEEAVGPRLFMAPELEDGRVDDISPKSDTYSLGKLLYWLLSEKVFSREKHREPELDLKGLKRWTGRTATEEHWDNIYMEHVNRLLDRMIVANPEERPDVHRVLQMSKDVVRLVQKEFNPIAKGIQQPCTYCGYGYYELRAAGRKEGEMFGFSLVGPSDWRILVCNKCGHVQLFRVEFAERKDWWAGSESEDWRRY
jgi:serine/threonine protein kinase